MTKEKEKVAHTPGPWKVAPYYRSDVLAGSGRLVATTRPFGTTQAEQDAHLIAAAPELLEALRALVAAVAPYDPMCDCTDCRAVRLATAAIAKAEGK